MCISLSLYIYSFFICVYVGGNLVLNPNKHFVQGRVYHSACDHTYYGTPFLRPNVYKIRVEDISLRCRIEQNLINIYIYWNRKQTFCQCHGLLNIFFIHESDQDQPPTILTWCILSKGTIVNLKI